MLQVLASGIISILTLSILHAQNLVPNPGFEAFEQCPPYPGQIHVSEAWDSPNNTTTDYFHRCSPVENGASVPVNLFGFQEPHQGDGYVGIRAWIPSGQNPIYREYIGVQLSQPLVEGKPYFVSFFISPGDASTFVSDGIGAYFSIDSLQNERIYPYQPQIRHPKGDFIRDFNRWVEVSGTYIAQGGEQYMVIGNFENDEETLKEPVLDNQVLSEVIYYYIDEVTVTNCETVETAISLDIDTVMCQGETLEIEPESNGVAYTWPDGSQADNFTITSAGSYPFTISHDQCSYTDTVSVKYLEFKLPYDSLTICEGENVDVMLPSNSEVFINDSIVTISSQINISHPGGYRFEVQEGRCRLRDTLEVITESTLNIFREIDTSLCDGDSLILGKENEKVEWRWQGISTAILPAITDSGRAEKIYAHTCFEERTIYNIELVNCTCNLTGPDVLTPNADGINDIWEPEMTNATNGHIIIFDRWGKELFQDDVLNFQWDGTYRNQRCDPGIYFWISEYTCDRVSSQITQGYFMLLY